MSEVINLIQPTLFNAVLPSGMKVTFREQNGEDDAIISRQGSAIEGSSINKFIAEILKEIDGQKVALNSHGIAKWKVRDKYSLLLKSRIASLGNTMTFIFKCPHCQKENPPLEENLAAYDWDYSKPFPDKDSPEWTKDLIPPYPNGKESERIIKLSSNKEIKYKYLDGVGEKMLLDIDGNDLNKNHELLCRHIEWKDESGRFIKLQNFRPFSAKDMAEIRKDIALNDPAWEGTTAITCQNSSCRKVTEIAVITQPDFFFPVQI
jgi:hypothetical protein